VLEPTPNYADWSTRIAIALLFSAAVHGMIMSTKFTAINPRLFEDNSVPIEVVLVNAKSREAPLDPDALGQVNLAGGGNTDDDRRMKSPLPASAETQSGSADMAMQAHVAVLEQKTRQLLTQLKQNAPSEPVAQTPQRETKQPDINVNQLAVQAREMAQLQARVSQQWDEYQKRPRRAFVGANVREYAFARYVDDWVAKVERIGNLNYPPTGCVRQPEADGVDLCRWAYRKNRRGPPVRLQSAGRRRGQDRPPWRALRAIPRGNAQKNRYFVDHPHLDLHAFRSVGGHRISDVDLMTPLGSGYCNLFLPLSGFSIGWQRASGGKFRTFIFIPE